MTKNSSPTKTPKPKGSWIRPYTDLRNSVKPVVSSVQSSSGFIRSIMNRLKGIKSGVENQKVQGNTTFKGWLQSEIDRQGFKSVEELNENLQSLTDTTIGTARIMTYLFVCLGLVLIAMLVFTSAGFFGWFNGTIWILISSFLMLQARFRAWWLLRRVAGLSFKSWLFSQRVREPLVPKDYADSPYTASEFMFSTTKSSGE